LRAVPNPAVGSVRIEGLVGRGDFRMLDAAGKCAVTMPGVLLTGSCAFPLDGLRPGLYVAEWTTAAGRATTRFAVE
jgi:hypothetical protein